MPSFRLLSVVAAWALPLSLVACGGSAPADPRSEAPLVRAVSAELADAALRSFTGTVAARVESDLGFRVSGKVMARLVDAGQAVTRGEVLMRIDPVDLQLAAQAQREAVAAARAQAEQAAEDEARFRDLRGTGAISASAYDQAKAAADAAQAQLRAVAAQAEVAANATRYTELVADADGVVMETLVEPGQVVNAGQVVVRLARAGAREAVIQLPETHRPQVGSIGEAVLFGNDGLVGPTRLRQLSEAADRLTRTFEARYVLEGKLADAPLGSTVTIRIPTELPAERQGIKVPMGALYDAGKGPGVWIIDGESSTVSWRPVAIQRLGDDSASVAGQLGEGDLIVALGAHLLSEGEQVRVVGREAVAATEVGQP